MRTRKILALALASAAVLLLIVAGVSADDPTGLTSQEALGKALFFDMNLSANGNQSCATCHTPEAGWVGADTAINAAGSVYEGSIPDAFGDRKPPTAAYGGDSPNLYYDEKEGLWIGGMFWDGRATGWTLDDPLAEQALGPFLNPVEQALPDAAAVVDIVKSSDYADLFGEVCGTDPEIDTADLYNCVGYSISAYEQSAEVNPYTSNYDLWLQGKAKLTAEEKLGMALFRGKAKCSACHLIKGKAPLFTDFTYDNLGIPKNPENPYTMAHPDWADPGLGGFLKSWDEKYPDDPEINWEAEWGKHKVPTLRNVGLVPDTEPDLVKAYGHNGYFKSLYGITHFYNTRDVKQACPTDHDYTEAEALAEDCWPAPEVPNTINTAEMGDLGLSLREELAIVAFMEALSDGATPTKIK